MYKYLGVLLRIFEKSAIKAQKIGKIFKNLNPNFHFFLPEIIQKSAVLHETCRKVGN
jgi:hypothetical protein